MRIAHAISTGAICALVATSATAAGPTIDIPTRAKGAQRIVVATVMDAQSSMSWNSYGDQVIISRLLEVQETMKGQAQSALRLDVEGGHWRSDVASL